MQQSLTLHVRAAAEIVDLEQLFVRLFADDPWTFWLDSSLCAEKRARFSFMGKFGGPHSLLVDYEVATRHLTVRTPDGKVESSPGKDVFAFLKNFMSAKNISRSGDLPFEFDCGFVGYLGYELKAECGAKQAHLSPTPDAQFIFADRMIAFDHETGTAYLLCLHDDDREAQAWLDQMAEVVAELGDSMSKPPSSIPRSVQGGPQFQPRLSPDAYRGAIRSCLEEIRNGESYEVCLTTKFAAECTQDPLSYYRVLRKVNPAPYSSFLRLGDLAVACSSPERFIRVDRSRVVETKPIKGTSPRGRDLEEDRRIANELRVSEKNRSENLMIVDLLRNDLGTVCEIGSVHVPTLMDVETYATVHQLVSTVRGRLRADCTAVDCVRAAFPGGSMTGAPKLRTMEIIDALEPEARGIYSGAIGYFGLSGGADFNIVIRTAVFYQGVLSIGVGGAIIALSDEEEELAEINLKGRALMAAARRTRPVEDAVRKVDAERAQGAPDV